MKAITIMPLTDIPLNITEEYKFRILGKVLINNLQIEIACDSDMIGKSIKITPYGNGECVRLGTLWPGQERSILPEKVSFCIPNSTVHNKDNGKNEYLYYNQFFIDEYNIQDLAAMNEFSTFLKSMGFLETDFLYVKYLNLLSAKEKPEIFQQIKISQML